MNRLACSCAFLLAALFLADAHAADSPAARPQFSRGLSESSDYFPIAVWLQSPRNAPRYKAIGINLYVGLWNGPTEQQLAELEKAGMPVICGLSERSKQFIDRKIIVGWMHGDEPDNAQALPGGKGYGPPIKPEVIVRGYERIRATDPTRPVMLNLGQGVAWDNWIGRGVRCNKPEDYPLYVKGADIVSFDIYPACHDNREVAGKLWYVPFGVDRLRKWVNDEKPVWTCIETTRISNEKFTPSPAKTRSEVWMAIIHGARGIIYFAHEFKPKFIEAGLLADAEMAKGVAATNAEIRELAPVINSPTVANLISINSSSKDVPIDIAVKQHGGRTYIFAVAMREGTAKGTFTILASDKSPRTVTVLHESRTVPIKEGTFTDSFAPYEVHVYRLDP